DWVAAGMPGSCHRRAISPRDGPGIDRARRSSSARWHQPHEHSTSADLASSLTCPAPGSVSADGPRVTWLPSCSLSPPSDRPAWRAGAGASSAGALGAAAVLAVVLGAVGAHAQLVPCRRGTDATQIADALDRTRRSVDPCGESPQIVTLLDELEHCTRARYQICTDTTASRNLFDRAGADGLGTITWNPELRSELEAGCGGDSASSVM